MTEYRFDPIMLLICTGDEGHTAHLPRRINIPEGTNGPITCALCGAPMALYDVIKRHPAVSFAELAYARPRIYYGARMS